jgi:hypothetical protein
MHSIVEVRSQVGARAPFQYVFSRGLFPSHLLDGMTSRGPTPYQQGTEPTGVLVQLAPLRLNQKLRLNAVF